MTLAWKKRGRGIDVHSPFAPLLPALLLMYLNAQIERGPPRRTARGAASRGVISLHAAPVKRRGEKQQLAARTIGAVRLKHRVPGCKPPVSWGCGCSLRHWAAVCPSTALHRSGRVHHRHWCRASAPKHLARQGTAARTIRWPCRRLSTRLNSRDGRCRSQPGATWSRPEQCVDGTAL